jgi:glutamate dehydrogenase/leucine dehydrogenase
MTLKFGLLGLPQGGAKAGIRADPDAPEAERYAALREFGEAVAPLLHSRAYIPGPDMGTSNEMVRRMLVSWGVPVRHRELRGVRPGYFTALSVFSAARHAAAAAGLEPAGAGVAIEGFGKVGSSLAELFAGWGAWVIAISTSRGALYRAQGFDVPELVRACRKQGSAFVESFAGAERIPLQDLFCVPADMLCPCARHNTIPTAMAGRIQARIIVPGANHPFDLADEKALAARGILCVPYWIANCGGTPGWSAIAGGSCPGVWSARCPGGTTRTRCCCRLSEPV